MKTRSQLRLEGIELHGPLVPDWFKARSDGCSVPTRIARLFLKAEQARAACYIHDFSYYLLSIQWKQSSLAFREARRAADNNLRRNRMLVARTKLFGWIYSRLYFRAVRIGGKYAVKLAPHLFIPPTVEAIEALGQHLYEPFTPMAGDMLKKWTRIRERA